jgi:RNA polymerase sigma-70 factor (ECF subfamily)
MVVRVIPGKAGAGLVTSYEKASDEQLMILFQNGDDRAFDCVMRRHTGLFWRLAKNYMGSAAEVDDLMQDVSLTLWQNRNSWSAGQGKFSTWLYRVIANRCIDLLRKKREETPGDDGIAEHITALPATAEDDLGRQQIAILLDKVLKEMPSQQALALRLYYYEEATVPEIAGRMDVSEVAARSLIKRGKQSLRDALHSTY